MKKLLSVLLAAVTTFSVFPAFAEQNEELEKVLTLVKERVGDTDGYEDFVSDFYTSKNSKTTYHFEWETQKENWEHIAVTCTEDGIITLFNHYDDIEYDAKPSINRFKKDEALRAAENELKRLNPEIASHIKITPQNDYADFKYAETRFDLQRYENDIPVAGDSGIIVLDENLKATTFFLSYSTGMTFADGKNFISREDAEKAYNEKLGAQLSYSLIYDDEEKKAKLVYSSQQGINKYISAQTGELIEINPYEQNDYYDKDAMEYVESGSSGGGLNNSYSEAEQNNLEELGELITKEQADNITRGCEFFDIPENAELGSINLEYSDYDESYSYNLRYIVKDENAQTVFRASVTLDAKTGEVKQFYKRSFNDFDAQKQPDAKIMTEKSKTIIAALAGEKASEYRINEENDNYTTYFTRYVNDIPFYWNNIYIMFDDEYNLISYSISYNDFDFPKPQNILSKEDAFKIMADIGNYNVTYMPDYNTNTYVAVYDFEDINSIDAFSGESIYKTDICSEAEYSDISGHYAEEKIKTLAEYGIFFEGEELHPDDVITQRDFMALLSIVFDYNSTEVLRNDEEISIPILKKTYQNTDASLKAPISRLDAAKLMIRAMGLDECAELSNIFKNIYNDVYEGIGYVNILSGMGVISGDGSGNFHPDAQLTRAQALVMIYNYLAI